MIITTISTLAYLNKAKVMAKSVKKYHPDALVILCLVEREKFLDSNAYQYFDKVILAKDLGIPNFEQCIFKYNNHEASIYLKGELLKYLLRTYLSYEKIVFLDADTRVYGPLIEMIDALDQHSIVLTPHVVLKSHPKYETIYLWDGYINTGMIGLKRTENSIRFIEWWSNKLEHYCYVDWEKFIKYSQGWAKLAPTFFEVHLLRHPGYNVAYWNLHERNIATFIKNQYLVNNTRLRVFHFSYLNRMLKDHVKEINRKDLSTLYNLYIEEINEMSIPQLTGWEWSYSKFNNGKQIKDHTRKWYRENPQLRGKYPNPFRANNWLLKNGMLELSTKKQNQPRNKKNRVKGTNKKVTTPLDKYIGSSKSTKRNYYGRPLKSLSFHSSNKPLEEMLELSTKKQNQSRKGRNKKSQVKVKGINNKKRRPLNHSKGSSKIVKRIYYGRPFKSP